MKIYEIRVKNIGEDSDSIDHLYYSKENAEKDCIKFNKLADRNGLGNNIYFVAPVEMQDELKD